jgi:hypothetical protein
MNPKGMTRRDALGMIGKTGVMFGAATCFYLKLEVLPLEAAHHAQSLEKATGQTAARPGRVKTVPEKVAISGSGSILTFRIHGPVGRHCGVSFATTGTLAKYRGVRDAVGVIGEDGTCTIKVEVKDLPNEKLFLRVGTSSGRDFKSSLAVSKPFIVHVADGRISRFEGVRDRGVNRNPVPAGCAVAAE